MSLTDVWTSFLESKIAERIEISLASYDGDSPSGFDQCERICHLGYITLDSNEISGFQSREQKRIPIERKADFIKLVLRGCYRNPQNVHSQVGIAGIKVMGRIIRNNAPVTKFEFPLSMPVTTSLPSCLKDDLDPKTRSTLDRLERMKKERASLEDFEIAGKIKESLSNVYTLLLAFKDCETNMRQSAAAEDYVSASRLKSERDVKRAQATLALQEVERQFIGRNDEVTGECIHKDLSSPLLNLKKDSPQKTILETTSVESRSKKSEANDEEPIDDMSTVGGEHPLLGVENAEELPAPEEISNNSIVSSDLVQKCEESFGSYRTRCFFSKNWVLREAALAKFTLLIPEICSPINGDLIALLCNIIEVGIDDKNMQVYLAALILLDELILHFECLVPPQGSLSPFFLRIITNLLGKLADSKQKIVDSVELTLLCLASSCCIDSPLIIKAATKRVRSRESKGGRTIKSRLGFLEKLAAEFAQVDGLIVWKKIINFVVTSNVFDHKDEGVRDASKSLIITLMAVSEFSIRIHYLLITTLVSPSALSHYGLLCESCWGRYIFSPL